MSVKVSQKPKAKEESPPPELMELEEETPIELTQPAQEAVIEELPREGGNFEVIGRIVPKFPARIIRANKQDQFFDWIDKLVDEDWSHLSLYLYREWPWIDRKMNDPEAPNYIDVIGSRVDLDAIKLNHGSGDYKIIVTDPAIREKHKSLGEAHFKINDPAYPPKIRLDELVVGHRSNKEFVDKLVAEGKLTPEGKIMPPQGTQGGIANDPALVALLTRLIDKVTSDSNRPVSKDSTTDAVISILTKTSEQAQSMLREQVKSDDPDRTVKLLNTFKDMLPKPEQGNSMLELVMKMQSDMAKVQADSQQARESMMMKMMELVTSKKSEEEGDSFDKMIDRMIKLKQLTGEGQSNPVKKSTVEVIGDVIEGIFNSPVMTKVADIGLNILNMQNFKAGMAKQAPQANPTTAKVIEVESQPVQAESEPVKDNVVEINSSMRTMLPMIQTMLPAMQRGQDGASFADGIENVYGPLVYDAIAALGKDEIIKTLKGIPQFVAGLAQIGASEAVLDKFVSEVIDWGKDEEQTETT